MRLYFLVGGKFGEKIIGNLANSSNFCKVCGNTCNFCRMNYGSFSSDIVGVIFFPRNLPEFIDNPEDYFPKEFPAADVLISINIQIDLLLFLPNLLKKLKAKALIVPIEDIDWCPLKIQHELESEVNNLRVDAIFPKPFCSLESNRKSIINEFIKKYRIGKPMFRIEINKYRVIVSNVLRSSPCGSSWFIANQIKGVNVNDVEEIVWKSNRIYPCIASMHIDPLTGQPFLNMSGNIAVNAVNYAIKNHY